VPRFIRRLTVGNAVRTYLADPIDLPGLPAGSGAACVVALAGFASSARAEA
jgi:hypothetical protein